LADALLLCVGRLEKSKIKEGLKKLIKIKKMKESWEEGYLKLSTLIKGFYILKLVIEYRPTTHVLWSKSMLPFCLSADHIHVDL
jgi:hypothetical protein